MANTNMTIRIDADVKSQLDRLCEEIGISASTAMNIFARKMVRERKFPFEVGAAPKVEERIEYPDPAEVLKASGKFINAYRKDFEVLAE